MNWTEFDDGYGIEGWMIHDPDINLIYAVTQDNEGRWMGLDLDATLLSWNDRNNPRWGGLKKTWGTSWKPVESEHVAKDSVEEFFARREHDAA